MNNTCPIPGPLFPMSTTFEGNSPTAQEVFAARILFTFVGAGVTALLGICTRNAYRILRGTHVMKVPICVYGPIAYCKPIEERDACEKISMCAIMLISACCTIATAAGTGYVCSKF